MKNLKKEDLKILLLEGVHQNAVDLLEQQGYKQIECHKKALSAEELAQKIASVHLIGIRSRTLLTADLLSSAKNLLAIGAFCIGTNQIDLNFAKKAGIPVFNAPFSNTRSVAELVLAEMIMMFRRVPEKNAAAHQGVWEKSAEHSFEARGKKLGIVGYGHIGSQLSVLAEGLGMEVFYYDIHTKLTIGNAKPCRSLKELLAKSNVVSLHVPATPETKNMIGAEELAEMKKGSYLINASRGNVVVIEALAQALQSGHLAGAAVDVFPKEPAGNDEVFESPLRAFDNVILTPHIGGSTQEAQANIALEVAEKLDKYCVQGATVGAVNFAQISLGEVADGKRRFVHIHQNVPGMLKKINHIFSARKINISGQFLQTDGEVGYVIVDIDRAAGNGEVLAELEKIPNTIKARMLN